MGLVKITFIFEILWAVPCARSGRKSCSESCNQVLFALHCLKFFMSRFLRAFKFCKYFVTYPFHFPSLYLRLFSFRSLTRSSSDPWSESLGISLNKFFEYFKSTACIAELTIIFSYPKTVSKRLSLHSSQVAHQAGAYPGFRNTEVTESELLPPGWDASLSQGYPPALSLPVPIYIPGWSEAL